MINSSETKQNLAAASADVRDRLSDYYWRINEAERTKELVRRSDGLVVDRKHLPPAGKRSEMNDKVRERAESSIGEKYGKLTVKSIAGSHPTNKAVMVKAECECGATIEDMLSNIITGKRPFCSKMTCPLAPRNAGKQEQGDENLENTHSETDLNAPRSTTRRPRRAKGVRTASKPAKKIRAKRSRDLVPVRATKAPGAAATNGHRDFRSISAVVESLATISEQVSLEDAQALVEELRRIEASPLSFALPGLPDVARLLPGYLKTAQAFAEFRQALEG